LTTELTKSLLGWKKSGAKGSYKLNEAVIRSAYDKIFKYLSIDGATKSRADIEDLKTALVTQETEMRGLKTRIDTLAERLGKQDAEVEELGSEIEDLKATLGIIHT